MALSASIRSRPSCLSKSGVAAASAPTAPASAPISCSWRTPSCAWRRDLTREHCMLEGHEQADAASRRIYRAGKGDDEEHGIVIDHRERDAGCDHEARPPRAESWRWSYLASR